MMVSEGARANKKKVWYDGSRPFDWLHCIMISLPLPNAQNCSTIRGQLSSFQRQILSGYPNPQRQSALAPEGVKYQSV